MTVNRLSWVRLIAAIAVGLTMVLMVLGAYVKATGSGLACPDWPTCYGKWTPPFPSADNGGTDADGRPVPYEGYQVMAEWTHRGVAAILGIPLIAFVALTVGRKSYNPLLRVLPLAAIVITGIQFGIGRATVLQGNPALLTTLHLATAVVILVTLTVAACVAFLRPRVPT